MQFNDSNLGQEMHLLCKELFPINRSLTGDGVRKTLSIIKKHLPQINEIKVRLLFLVRMRSSKKDTFNLYEYRFKDEEELTSIEFVRAVSYLVKED